MISAARNDRTILTIQRVFACITLALMAIASASAVAQPTRPVRIIVTVSAGGSIDAIARAIAEELGMDAASGWHGFFAPAGTDAAIIHKINGAAVRILQTPSMKARVAALGAEPAWSSGEELACQLANDLDRLGAVVKKTNARAE